MISTWQQHSDNSSSGLPALASAAAAAQDALESAENEKERAEQPQPGTEEIEAKRVGSNTQSDPIEPQPTPFEAFTQAPLSTEKPDAALKPKMQAPEIFPSTESSAMGFSQLSVSRKPSDVRTASIRTGGTGSMVLLFCPPFFLHFWMAGCVCKAWHCPHRL